MFGHVQVCLVLLIISVVRVWLIYLSVLYSKHRREDSIETGIMLISEDETMI